jgi:ABC-2 type transport system permease protein
MRLDSMLAVLNREMKIRATNAAFIFWDVFYPLAYLLVFGVAMTRAVGFTAPGLDADYNAFFLGGVLAMASFAIASNTAWSFFMDRDNGIFYEMLTYPMSRGEYLLGKVLFNVAVALVQAFITVLLAALLLGVPVTLTHLPLLVGAVSVGTACWFFFYAIFALKIRRNDAFNTVTSVFYFVFLFASSMFYPLEPLPQLFRTIAYLNPITWHVDVLRFATIGMGDARVIAVEAAAFVVFGIAAFAVALRALRNQE